MYRVTLSLKYLLSRRLNVICVLGVSLGVMLLIVVLSVMDGFQDQLRKTLRGSLSDLIITPRYEIDFPRLEAALRDREPEVVALSPQLHDFAIVAPADRKDVKAGTRIIGVDAKREMAVSEFGRYLWISPPEDEEKDEDGKPGKAKKRKEKILSVADPERPFWPADQEDPEKFPGIILGRTLAERGLDMIVIDPLDGETVRRGSIVYLLTAVVQTGDEKESELKTREMRFIVTGFYESGNAELDESVVYVDREAASRFTGGRRELAEIRVKLRSFDRAGELKWRLLDTEYELFRLCARDPGTVAGLDEQVEEARLEAARAGREFRTSDAFPPRIHLDEGVGTFFIVQTWEDRRRIFLSAIENEKRIMAVILFFIILVSAFMIVAMLSMLVVHKTRDIGIVKALGGTTRGVLSIFMWNGLIMGIVGAILGVGLGLLVTAYINTLEGILSSILGRSVFPQSIYNFDHIPTRTDPVAVLVTVLVAILCSWLAALYPALRAARMNPVEALRYE